MRNKDFYDEMQAKAYLNDSIIRFKELPIYVQDIQFANHKDEEKLWRITYSDLGRQNNKMCFLPNPHIDLNPVPLGMINGENYAWYMQRIPIRNWKIGLSRSNSNHQYLRPDYKENFPGLISKAMRECILGIFPSYVRCLESMYEEHKKVAAFSRSFAISGTDLLYKCCPYPVGVCYTKGPKLSPYYKYLEEILFKEMK